MARALPALACEYRRTRGWPSQRLRMAGVSSVEPSSTICRSTFAYDCPTTDTRSPAELPDMSDAADRKAVFARALLRDVRHVFRADVDPGAEYRAKLAQQRLLGRRAEVGCAHDLQHDVIQRRLHDLQLLEPGNRRQVAGGADPDGDSRARAAAGRESPS